MTKKYFFFRLTFYAEDVKKKKETEQHTGWEGSQRRTKRKEEPYGMKGYKKLEYLIR